MTNPGGIKKNNFDASLSLLGKQVNPAVGEGGQVAIVLPYFFQWWGRKRSSQATTPGLYQRSNIKMREPKTAARSGSKKTLVLNFKAQKKKEVLVVLFNHNAWIETPDHCGEVAEGPKIEWPPNNLPPTLPVLIAFNLQVVVTPTQLMLSL